MKMPRIKNPFEKFHLPPSDKLLPALAVLSPVAAGVVLIEKNPEGFKKNIVGLHNGAKKDLGDLFHGVGGFLNKMMLPLTIGGIVVIFIILKK